MVQLEPFVDSTLLAALLEGPGKRRLLLIVAGCQSGAGNAQLHPCRSQSIDRLPGLASLMCRGEGGTVGMCLPSQSGFVWSMKQAVWQTCWQHNKTLDLKVAKFIDSLSMH